MRVRGRLAEQHQRETARKAKLRKSIQYVLRKLRLRHPHVQRLERGSIRIERDAIGVSHDLDLVRRLHSSAGIGDRLGGSKLNGRIRQAHLVVHEGAGAAVDRDFAGRDAPIPENGRDDRLGTLILLPDADVESAGDLVLGPPLLERGGDDDGLSGLRENEGEEALTPCPVDAGEVRHVRARLDEHG